MEGTAAPAGPSLGHAALPFSAGGKEYKVDIWHVKDEACLNPRRSWVYEVWDEDGGLVCASNAADKRGIRERLRSSLMQIREMAEREPALDLER